MDLLDRQAQRLLPQLVDAACALIDRAGLTPEDARVALHPDARTVRYYQSLGLVDRPLRYDGRSAVYGWTHLVQVVAVKLLQARGEPLERVQAAFAGLPFARLEAAVLQALGAGEAPTQAPPPPPGPRPLIAAELAPGVLVTLDPALVPDPHALLQRLRRALGSPFPPEVLP